MSGVRKLLKVLAIAALLCFLVLYLSLQETPLDERRGVSYGYVEQVLASYKDGFHSYSYGICGYSVESRPIHFYSIGEGEETVLIIGGLHGNEPKGTYACLELLKNLTESEHLLKEYRFVVIPLCNPDGAEKFRRFNSRGVDLNRDFYGLSQPETQAIQEVFLKTSPVLLVDVHESLGSQPMIIYANNTKSWLLARFFSSEHRIPAALAGDVGQSANFAERGDIYGIIVELPMFSWDYKNGTVIVLQIILSWERYRRSNVQEDTLFKDIKLDIGFMIVNYPRTVFMVEERVE